ncbi:helix-turn-helix domain-containing protein [Caenimonas sedimenti]|uniref:Helix-turn-helix domain-containing protein n=1 Tax=Caenimonas sedimenti TaxID=2596921 RepID=A0A562ZTC3_9BURK|nr:helix-turn-helix domain-containing protein [Caenimonas sedimenti]TWO71647.1 helix-turn-helix domain-containing protein [Caenimonas sedimenti]
MLIEWSTASSTPSRRFEQWREACAEHVYALSLERSDDGPFDGRIARRQLGALDVTDIRCDRHVVRRTGSDIRQQPGADFYVYLQRRGQVWMEQGSRTEVVQPGDMIIADPNVAFSTGTDGSFDLRIWRIPRERLAPLLALGSGELPMVKLARHNGEGALVSDWLDALLRNAHATSPASLDLATSTLCTLVAGAVGASPETQQHGPAARRQALLQQVMRRIESSATDLDFSSVRVAGEFGISLRTLHQLFALSDTTFHDFLTSVRLARASELLREPRHQHTSTIEVGFAAGFAEASTFYRRFKQRYGVTPGEYRAVSARD